MSGIVVLIVRMLILLILLVCWPVRIIRRLWAASQDEEK